MLQQNKDAHFFCFIINIYIENLLKKNRFNKTIIQEHKKQLA